ncbi:MAG: N-acetylmuramic acid 6-phosphate etherase [Elusimicrobiota bacterium]|jgi:N-acetylmuramic acid 6-phosphate etherase|nr:N-acetylmuramic acid 6-phosphate etherase [Elusimicrobiota bacterium]
MENISPIPTETRNPRTRNLDLAGAAGIIAMINREDRRTVEAVRKASKQLETAVKETAKRFAKGGKIIFIGAGTSGRLGILEAAECPPTFSTDPRQITGIMAGGKNSVFKAKEGAEDSAELGRRDIIKAIGKGDIVFGIAASGRTPYVMGALAAAKKAGAYTNLVTCNDSADGKAADNIIYLATGPEALQGSTRMKAGTATKMVLNIITTSAMVLCGKVYKNYMVDVKAGNKKLRARAVRLVCAISGVAPAAAEKALKAVDFKVKNAVVMIKLNVDKNKAQALIEKHKGRLRDIIGGSDD